MSLLLGGAVIGKAAAPPISPMSLSGSLSAISTSGTVTSATRTVTVPAGNSGIFTFASYVDTGTITNTRYSRNGGAFATVTDGSDTVAFSNGDTIAVLTNSVDSGESRTFNAIDKTTGATIEAVSHIYA